MAELNGTTITGTAAGTIQKDQFVSFGYDFANATCSDNFYYGHTSTHPTNIQRVSKNMCIANGYSGNSYGVIVYLLNNNESSVTRTLYTAINPTYAYYVDVGMFNQNKGIIAYTLEGASTGQSINIYYRIFTINSNSQIIFGSEYTLGNITYEYTTTRDKINNFARNMVDTFINIVKLNSDDSITIPRILPQYYQYVFPYESAINSNQQTISIRKNKDNTTEKYDIYRNNLNSNTDYKLFDHNEYSTNNFSYCKNKYLFLGSTNYIYIYSIDSGFTTVELLTRYYDTNFKTYQQRVGRTMICCYLTSESYGAKNMNFYTYRFDGNTTVVNEGTKVFSMYGGGMDGYVKTITGLSMIPIGTGKLLIAGCDNSDFEFAFILTVPIKVYPALIGEEFDGVALASASNGASVQVSAKF